MAHRLIRVSSRALGEKQTLRVHIYDTPEDLRQAATAFNGADHTDTVGVCQLLEYGDGQVTAIVRLARTHLGTQFVSHEVHHATTAIYGAHIGPDATAAEHLTHYNEPFAHLYSDLLCRLVNALHAHGYYD